MGHAVAAEVRLGSSFLFGLGAEISNPVKTMRVRPLIGTASLPQQSRIPSGGWGVWGWGAMMGFQNTLNRFRHINKNGRRNLFSN